MSKRGQMELFNAEVNSLGLDAAHLGKRHGQVSFAGDTSWRDVDGDIP